MLKRILYTLTVGVLVGSSLTMAASKAEKISMKSMLTNMINRDVQAEYPSTPYKCKQFSSYSRRAVSPTKGWFSNWDWSNFLRIEKNAGRRLEECAPELNEQFVRQVNGIIEILKSRGIVVHQVKKHIPSEEAFLAEMNDTVLQTYPRDPMLVIGNRFIETAMFEPNRRKERFAIRRTIGERLANSNARIISMPEPEPLPADENGKYGPGPFLEGGDVHGFVYFIVFRGK